MRKNRAYIFLFVLFTAININSQAQKTVIDKVVAIVGENEILYSEIQNQYMQYLMQSYGKENEEIRCRIFEEALFGKLLLNKAQLDSIEVSDEMVDSEIDQRLQYFISQIGSKEKLEEYYKKSILEIKNDLRPVIRNQMLSEQVKRQITQSTTITPSEVRKYFDALPKDSIPMVNSEYSYSQIVMVPKVQEVEKQYAYQKIKGIRDRVIKGESFESLARLYSEDPGSSMRGGELGDFGRGVMFPEFEAAAFSLQPNQISDIIETEAGYHIIKLIKRKGDFINVRHILIMTKISPLSLQMTKSKLDSVYKLIESGKMTFEEAALKFSEDDSKYSNGIAINPRSGNAVFAAENIDENLFFDMEKMNVGAVLPPQIYEKERNVKAFRIVRLDKRTSPHKANLETDYDRIQEYALAVKKSEAVSNWIKENANKTYILIIDKELKSCNFTYDWQ